MVEKSYYLKNSSILPKALFWAQQFTNVSYLNHNNIPFPYGPFPHILAVANETISLSHNNSFTDLEEWLDKNNEWLFGYFGYDLKNQVEDLDSKNPDSVGLDDISFFTPLHLLFFEEDRLKIISPQPDKILEEISTTITTDKSSSEVSIEAKMVKEEYLQKVQKIRKHIEEGDIYELNLCMEFTAQNVILDAVHLYFKLCDLSPMPFSGFQKYDSTYLLCASPERFLKKIGDKVISQPIKGTIRRGNGEEEDLRLKEQLANDEKEISENMMIVDLVRNDLAKTGVPGSIKAEELFGLYSFSNVHQMISTVTSFRKKEVSPIDIIKNAFPMGSMTGAPKIRSMQLIEMYENSKRGLYSGTIGYFAPDKDFDFNVVIRSLIYNSDRKNLSFQVGGAITYDSSPEKEYQECLLKARAVFELLGATIQD